MKRKIPIVTIFLMCARLVCAETTQQGLVQQEEVVPADSSNKIKQLESQLKDAQEARTKLQTENEELKQTLLACNRTRITNIAVGKVIVGDSFVHSSFTTNMFGDLKVQIYDDSGAPNQAVQQRQTQTSKSHLVTFDGLAPRHPYHIRVVALDSAGNEIPVTVHDASTDPDLLRFTTAAQEIIPVVQFERVIPDAGKIELHISLDSDAQLSVKCFKRIPGHPADQLVDSWGSEQSDQFGLPRDETLFHATADIPIVFQGLAEDSEYLFIANIRSRFGREKAYKPTATTRTLKTPLSLEFDDVKPVSVTISPTEYQIQWKTTAEPDTAYARVVLANQVGSYTVNAVKGVDHNTLTATFKKDLFPAIFQLTEREAAPAVTCGIQRGQSPEKVRTFQLTYKIPATGVSDSTLQSAVGHLEDAKAKPEKKKLSWQDIITFGLPMIMKTM